MMIKKGVKMTGMSVPILLAINIANEVYKKNYQELVVTELTGGQHGRSSLHYVGNAVDIRTRDISSVALTRIAAQLVEALGENYDVVKESTHIHIEYQPK